jgi:hypothetical protein
MSCSQNLSSCRLDIWWMDEDAFAKLGIFGIVWTVYSVLSELRTLYLEFWSVWKVQAGCVRKLEVKMLENRKNGMKKAFSQAVLSNPIYKIF